MSKYLYEVMTDYGIVYIQADSFFIDSEILTFMDCIEKENICKGVFKKWNYFINKGICIEMVQT